MKRQALMLDIFALANKHFTFEDDAHCWEKALDPLLLKQAAAAALFFDIYALQNQPLPLDLSTNESRALHFISCTPFYSSVSWGHTPSNIKRNGDTGQEF